MACACSTGWWPISTRNSALFALILAAAAGLAPQLATAREADASAVRMLVETLPLRDDKGRVDARAGSLAFVAAGEGRPVTFVVGGGPGTSSAYLNLGAAGPRRIDFSSRSAALLPNAESWLAFTDLVFIDPPGVGQGRLLGRLLGHPVARERVWSVEGDVDLLADAIAAWLRRHARIAAPKALVGQSYGGLRAPRIAEALHRRHGLALRRLVLISPILDYGWRYHARTSPLSFATLLPSFAAARMEAAGDFDAERLRAVEDYARTAFVEDYLRGAQDKAATARMVERVTEISGLPRAVVEAARGRVDEKLFAREIARKDGKLASSYDAALTGDDPDPASPRPDYADPFLGGLKAPLTVAMAQMLKDKGGPYVVASETVFEAWRWDSGHGLPEAVSALRRMLALDPDLRVLVAHGYSDLQTPYFESALILDQLPDFGKDRVQRRTYRGGHMFYGRDDARRALRDDIRAFLSDIGTSDTTAPGGSRP